MNKTLEQWSLVDAALCASSNSVAANQYLIADAKQDIAILGGELSRLRTENEELRAKLVDQKYDDTLLPFVALMRKELHANASKGDRPGWLAMSADTCLLEIIYHFGKLQASVKRGDGDGMAEYAADVANMCMMLLDICGALHLATASPATLNQQGEAGSHE